MAGAGPGYRPGTLSKLADGFWDALRGHRGWTAVACGLWLAATAAAIGLVANHLSPAHGAAVRGVHGAALTEWSYGLTVNTLLLITFLLGLALHAGGSSLTSLVVGVDGRTSTSKTQYLLWTAGVAFALTDVAIRTSIAAGAAPFSCSATVMSNCVPGGDTWDQYVILLGVPAAAAVVAKATTAYKAAAGSLQQTGGGSPQISDVATDGNGQADLADVQYLIFNIIAFVYFAAHFLIRGTFVTMPAILLGLTSASAATYVLSKVVSTNQPTIRSVTPTTIGPGAEVTITGSNLAPDPASPEVRINIAGAEITGNAAPGRGATDTITFSAPYAMAPVASAAVTVTINSSGVQTDPYAGLAIVGPTILGWAAGAPAAAGGQATVSVAGLPAAAAGHGASPRYRMVVNGVVAAAEADPAQGTMTFPLPAWPARQAARGAQTMALELYADDLQVAATRLAIQ